MADVVVTVPRDVWARWLEEGDCAGEPETGQLYEFSVPFMPKIGGGERVYVVAHGRLRGYAPLVKAVYQDRRAYLIRGGDAVAVTIPERIGGFRGFRYRWWDEELEQPFPDWRTP